MYEEEIESVITDIRVGGKEESWWYGKGMKEGLEGKKGLGLWQRNGEGKKGRKSSVVKA